MMFNFFHIFSYASLIRLAISNAPKHKMTLSEIYQFIIDHFPYYREAGTGWKVSSAYHILPRLFKLYLDPLAQRANKL